MRRRAGVGDDDQVLTKGHSLIIIGPGAGSLGVTDPNNKDEKVTSS
jgi:hypothetical protein